MQAKKPRRRITKRQVAELRGYGSTDTVDRRIRAGKLPPGVRDGGKLYWWLDEILDGMEREAAQQAELA